jgi:P4 family phage/plasmid primase-like protien
MAAENDKGVGLNIADLADYLAAITPAEATTDAAGAEAEPQPEAKIFEFPGPKSGGGGPPMPPSGPPPPPPKPPPPSPGGAPIFASEDMLAVRIVEAMNGLYRYVPEWKTWMYYTGECWIKDTSGEAVAEARWVCRETSQIGVLTDSARRTVSSERVMKAALRLAGASQSMGLALSHKAFDADGLLLGTPAGVIELKTGVLRPMQQNDYISKLTAASPVLDLTHGKMIEDYCPLWMKFLHEFTSDDKQMIEYLQRVFGYCATGLLREHAVIMLLGERGGEGKGACVRTVARVLGDYAKTAPEGLFERQTGERHTTDLAYLEGARMILVSEVNKGAELNESRLRRFSGGDKITARYIGADNFEFFPVGTLVFLINDKPRLPNGGVGFDRRLQLAEFTFVPPVPDLDLEEKLWAEKDAILTWIIQGAVSWWRIGLRPPPSVVSASRAYYAEQDVVRRFVWDHYTIATVDTQGEPFISQEDAFRHYLEWTDAHKDYDKLTERKLNKALAKQKGIHRKEKRVNGEHKRGFCGLRKVPGLHDEPKSEQSIVLEMREMRAAGKAEHEIAKWLSDRHHKTLDVSQVAHVIERWYR